MQSEQRRERQDMDASQGICPWSSTTRVSLACFRVASSTEKDAASEGFSVASTEMISLLMLLPNSVESSSPSFTVMVKISRDSGGLQACYRSPRLFKHKMSLAHTKTQSKLPQSDSAVPTGAMSRYRIDMVEL